MAASGGGWNPLRQQKKRISLGIHNDMPSKKAREWFSKFESTWAATHSSKIILRQKSDLFPWLGSRPIVDITVPVVLVCLRRIVGRGALDTTHRA